MPYPSNLSILGGKFRVFATSGGMLRYWFSSCLNVPLHIKMPIVSRASSLFMLALHNIRKLEYTYLVMLAPPA